MRAHTTHGSKNRNILLFFVSIGILFGCAAGIGIYFKTSRETTPQDTKDQIQTVSDELEGYHYTEEISYYPIWGSTKADLIDEMNQSGIEDEKGIHRFAYTGWYTHWDYTYTQTETSCSIDDIKVFMDVSILIPRWEDDPHNGSDLSKKWKMYSEKLLDHEYLHRDSANECGKKILSELRAIPSQATCRDLQSALQTKSSALLEECNKRDVHIDEVTNHGINDGVIF